MRALCQLTLIWAARGFSCRDVWPCLCFDFRIFSRKFFLNFFLTTWFKWNHPLWFQSAGVFYLKRLFPNIPRSVLLSTSLLEILFSDLIFDFNSFFLVAAKGNVHSESGREFGNYEWEFELSFSLLLLRRWKRHKGPESLFRPPDVSLSSEF
jgi:hypothetical protein